MTEQNRRADDKRAPGKLQWGESAAPASADNPSTAGGDLHIGVSNNDQGVHINIIQRHADGTATVIYTAKAPAGDSCGRVSLAAPVAQSTAGDAKAVGSIEDYAQFHNLLGDWMRARDYWQDDAAAQVVEKWQKFIAYIDARLAAPAAQAPTPTAAEVRTAVARAIWNIRREDEDRCDMELEDMGEEHSVWAEADAAIRALRTASKDQFSALGEKGGDGA